MDQKVNRTAPRNLTDSLDASVRDLAAEAVHPAVAAQQQAQRMLADFEQTGADRNRTKRPKTA